MMSTKATQKNTLPAQLQPLLDHQQALAVATEGVQKLQAASDELDRKIARASARWPAPVNYGEQLENLYAAQAVGTITQAEVAAREQEITRERQEAFAGSEAVRVEKERLEHARRGLHRQIVAAQDELARLNASTPGLVAALLNAETASAALDYMDAALKVKEAFIRLAALNDLASGHGGSNRAWNSWGDFKLPSVKHEAFSALERPTRPGVMFDFFLEQGYGAVKGVTERERMRLRDFGVAFV
jgi:hypothetical protein